MSTVAGTGGELAPGWRVEVKTRSSGGSAGTNDAVSTLLSCILVCFVSARCQAALMCSSDSLTQAVSVSQRAVSPSAD